MNKKVMALGVTHRVINDNNPLKYTDASTNNKY